jgi:hypothetical protein
VGALTAVLGDQAIVYCTGTLIAQDQVLTAAHCVAFMDDFTAYGAETWFLVGNDLTRSGGVEDMALVASVAIHPDYDPVSLAHDLAVMGLAEGVSGEPMPLTEQTPGDSWAGRELWHIGFGLTGWDEEETGVKREVMLPIYTVTADHLVHYDPGGDNLCLGDSGGPAIDPSDGSIVGVASYVWLFDEEGTFCDEGGSAAARVDIDADWITEVAALGSETDPGEDDSNSDSDPEKPEPTTGTAGQLPDDDTGLSCANVLRSPAKGPLVFLALTLVGVLRRQSTQLEAQGPV